MKKYILSFIALAVVCTSCSDFEDMNNDPFSVDINKAEPEYFLNNSILGLNRIPILQNVLSSFTGKLQQDST
jgi:hypothetical protein